MSAENPTPIDSAFQEWAVREVAKTAKVARQVWIASLRRMARYAWKSVKVAAERKRNPWFARAEAMVQSLKLRRHGRAHKARARTPATTWEEALKRLWEQGYAAAYNRELSPWYKWAANASHNSNRRRDAKEERDASA